ncbi:hypothetical protein BLNAU_5212 [Blattamonas nauphoetae]|uniref:Uncharacterized protein n=1 Tax=Blattamonas nauphoetae TaxID=2049346 RepID=A0ABQ9Y7Q9_9EUKA|nr:hypothetical protein BLNAU_5212 [Blattamonas nauphoetae]
MPVGTSALYGTDSPISRVAFENSFRTSLNTPERAESNVTVTDHITPTRDQDDDFFDNGDHITPPRLPLTPTEEPYPHYPTDRDTETIDSLPLAFGTPSHSYTHSVASFNLSLLTMDTFSSLFPTPPTIRIDPPSLPLEETLPGQAPLLPLLTDLRAQFANIPRPSLVPPSIIDSESQDGLLPTPAHKLDLTAPLRLLSSNSIDRGPIPPPAMSPHPSPPPQPKSFFNYRPKPPKPPNRSKSKNTSSLQPLILATVIPEHQKLPSPSPPNPKAVVPHTPPHRSKAKNSSPFRPPLPSTVIFEHPDSPFPSPPKAKSAVPPMPKIHTFRTFIPQSQRQNDSEQTTVIPEHPNSPFPSPPKAKAKERRMPTIRSFRTFIPQSQRQNGTEEVFTIVQCDPVKPHPVSKAKSLPRLPPLPKAKPRRQLPKAASVPPNQEAGRREIHFEASSLNPYQRNYRYAEQSLAAGLQRLFGSTYDPTNIFNYEPLSYLKKRVRLFLLQKNLNLFRYYIRFFYPAPRQSWYIGSVMRIIDRRLRFTWIRNERFPDNVFLDMRKLTPLEERNIRPRSVVVFLIRVNRYPSSYFEAREAFLYQRKIQDTSVLKLPEPPGRW